MPDNAAKIVKSNRANELDTLARLLEKYALCADVSPLYKAATKCRQDKRTNWHYELDELIFRPASVTIKNSVPKIIQNCSITLTVQVEAQPSHQWVKDFPQETTDPFVRLDFNIDLRATRMDGPKPPQPVFCSWHLDRNEDPLQNDKQKFMHPHYHLQFGGKHMWRTISDDLYDYGAALVLEAPRFAHPPMDAILGVDFLLTNFYFQAELKIRQDAIYRKLLADTQLRVWRPYAETLFRYWKTRDTETRWEERTLWPQLMPGNYSAAH